MSVTSVIVMPGPEAGENEVICLASRFNCDTTDQDGRTADPSTNMFDETKEKRDCNKGSLLETEGEAALG